MMSDPGSDFRLYHSNSLDVLAALLARNVRAPVPGQPLLAPEVVLIPQVAMRRWLQATLAAEFGVAANLEFLTPGEFVARALKEVTKCDKLNIAALGNAVPQLHVHVIARRKSDAAWPRPVWGAVAPVSHDAQEVQHFISALRRKIWLG